MRSLLMMSFFMLVFFYSANTWAYPKCGDVDQTSLDFMRQKAQENPLSLCNDPDDHTTCESFEHYLGWWCKIQEGVKEDSEKEQREAMGQATDEDKAQDQAEADAVATITRSIAAAKQKAIDDAQKPQEVNIRIYRKKGSGQ